MRREHAQVERGAINRDTDSPIRCQWDDCDRPRGYLLYRHIYCLHDKRAGCQWAEDRAVFHGALSAHQVYLFCSMRHRNYFVNAYGANAQESIARTGRAYGNLPAGLRRMIG